MSNQIPTAFVNQFSANVQMLAQQMDSRLPQACRQETLRGELGFFDQIGVVEAVERTSRHADTPFTEVPHARRAVAAQDWEMSDIIDRQDTQRMLTSPQSSYVQTFAAGMNRRKDRVIMNAFFAPARTGKTGAATVAFPASQTIAVNYVETGTATDSSLTIEKLRRARELLMDAEVSEGKDLFIACSQRELTQLLRTTQVTSADFNSVQALVHGHVDAFMGFEFIRVPSGLIPTDGTNRRIPCWHRQGMLFAPLEGGQITRASEDPTKGYNTRIYMSDGFGATRMEEVRVVDIRCSPTALT
jgi:hypothetical protein